MARVSFLIIFSLICLSIEHTSLSASPPLPKAMAALGDSITEGMLTDFSLERPPSFFQVLRLLNDSRRDDRTDYFRKNYVRKNHSWSTGEDDQDFVLSHYERLKKLQPGLRADNYAVSGSESSELIRQVEEMIATERSEAFHYDYITLMSGANDMRRESLDEFISPVQYAENIKVALKRLLDENSDRRILLAGMPPIHEIFETSADFIALSIWNEKVSCSEMRIKTYGPLVVFRPEEVESYEASKFIFYTYQSALAIVAEELSRDYPEASIRAAINYRGRRTTKKTLSIDCFHPAPWGQGEIAERTWKLGFWP